MNEHQTTNWRRHGDMLASFDIGTGSSHTAEGAGGLHDLFAAIWSKALWLGLWMLLAVGIAVIYLITATPQFSATTQIALEPRWAGSISSDTTAMQPSTLDSAQADSQVQVVQSERVLRYVFDQLNLAGDPDYAAGPPGMLARLFGLLPGRAGAPLSPQEQAARQRAVAFQAFSDKLSVKRLGQSYVIEITFRARDGAKAARLANAVTAAYVRDQIQFHAAAVGSGTPYLQGRIADVQKELDATSKAVLTGTIPDMQLADSDARVVSAATEPLGKSSPLTTLVLLLAVVLSLVSGIGFVVLRHAFDRKVRTRKQVMHALATDRVIMAPRFRRGARTGHAVPLLSRDVHEGEEFLEALRLVRIAAREDLASSRHQVIGVTSWSSGEGRSTVAANLASLIAASREPAVLVDADFRHPALSRWLAPDAAAGLDGVLLGHDATQQVLQLQIGPNLTFLPATAHDGDGNPNVFLGSDTTANVLAALRNTRDVIVDLAPISVSSDTQAIGHLLDGVVLVVEANRATLENLHEAASALRVANVRLLAVVFNKVGQGARRRLPARRDPH